MWCSVYSNFAKLNKSLHVSCLCHSDVSRIGAQNTGLQLATRQTQRSRQNSLLIDWDRRACGVCIRNVTVLLDPRAGPFWALMRFTWATRWTRSWPGFKQASRWINRSCGGLAEQWFLNMVRTLRIYFASAVLPCNDVHRGMPLWLPLLVPFGVSGVRAELHQRSAGAVLWMGPVWPGCHVDFSRGASEMPMSPFSRPLLL